MTASERDAAIVRQSASGGPTYYTRLHIGDPTLRPLPVAAEADAVRVVRPGWATTFERQPIVLQRAAVVRSDVPVPAKAIAKKAAAAVAPDGMPQQTLARYIDQEPASVAPLRGGHTAEGDILTYEDGTRLVRKRHPGMSPTEAERTADAEALGAAVARATGVRAPTVTTRPGGTVWQEFVEGERGYAFTGDGLKVPQAILDSADGRRLGIADALMDLGDRSNPGNWLRTADGRLVALDHGAGFQFGSMDLASPGPFGRRFISGSYAQGPLKTGTITPAEYAEIRANLVALRPEFVRRGRLDWYEQINARLDRMAGTAATPAKATKAAAKKAPAKKVAAPKPPTPPERMSTPALTAELRSRGALEPFDLPGGGTTTLDLAGVPKDTLAGWVTRARELRPDQLAEEVGRWRQVIIDRRRVLAEVLSEADELVENLGVVRLTERDAQRIITRIEGRARRAGAAFQAWPEAKAVEAVVHAIRPGATPAQIRRSLAAAARRGHLVQVGPGAGTRTFYDPATMTPAGGSQITAGARVTVVRPGYAVPDGTVIARTVVVGEA